MSGRKLITDASESVLTLEEVKAHLRITQGDEDGYLELLTKAVVRAFEQTARTSILPQTWQLALDAAPTENWIELTPAPLRSVTIVKSYAEDDTETVFDPDHYRVDTFSEPGRVVLKRDRVWPSDLRPVNAIIIEYITGLAANKAAVPMDLKLGLAGVVAGFYEKREPVSEVTGQKVQLLGGELLAPYKAMRI